MRDNERALKLWTGCDLYIPLLISKTLDSMTIRFPEYGDSLSLPLRNGWTLKEAVADIERGESLTSFHVMGWAICTRRARWMRATREKAGK